MALIISLVEVSNQRFPNAALDFGIACCIGGVICLFFASIFGVVGRFELAKSMLISAGITFLIGTGVCSAIVLPYLH